MRRAAPARGGRPGTSGGAVDGVPMGNKPATEYAMNIRTSAIGRSLAYLALLLLPILVAACGKGGSGY